MPRKRLPSGFPYHPGLELSIKRHIPPEPFAGPSFLESAAPRPIARDPRGGPYRTPLEWCLDFPPTDTKPAKDPEVRRLHVVDQVACGAERAAQVVRCYLDDTKGTTYIAKMFDALYFWPEDGDHTYEADANYASEAAAYEDLMELDMDGHLTPHYHGSWTFDLPVPSPHSPSTRSVRMILIEDIRGRSMGDILEDYLETFILPKHRLAVLARVMEIYSVLEYVGIVHMDLAPRNVMIMGVDFNTWPNHTMPEVLLIDFNRCALLNRPSSYFPQDDNTNPIDPKTYLTTHCPDKWKDWVPEPHRSNPAAWRGWVRKLWPNSEDYSQPRLRSRRFDDLGDFIEVLPQPDPQYVRPPSPPTESDGEL
uniref:non-specific serine/threonine protein kinase n=1 Tax=Bionectria ochroleuca TaxID=29856 RepID=A0A8H7TSD3_BIOOC